MRASVLFSAAALSLVSGFLACSGESDRAAPGTQRLAVLADGEATGVFGQQGDFSTAVPNKGGRSAESLAAAAAVTTADDGRVFIADTDSSRVLMFPAASTVATRVYGQGGSFSQGAANAGGVSADSLNNPQGLAWSLPAASLGLWISDTLNNRVLFFPEGTTTATVVIGQSDFATNSAHVASATHVFSPAGLAVTSAGDLYVADKLNNRVLMFPVGTTTATRVYGQLGSFSSSIANPGGVSADTLFQPTAVAIDPSGGLYIADGNNRRVLHYAGNSTSADKVWGQPDFDSSAAGSGQTGFGFVGSIALREAGSELWVSDGQANRVLGFLAGSTSAGLVLGQQGSFTSSTANLGGRSARSLNAPSGIAAGSDGTLFVADGFNNRVLSFAASCLTSGCDDGNDCTDDSCESNGTCSHTLVTTAPDSCLGFACNPATKQCYTSCAADGECSGARVCRAGRCTNQCSDSTECVAGDSCSQGWCCDSACGGSCQSCSNAGSEGTCQTALEGDDPQNVCLGFGCTSQGSCRPNFCAGDAGCSAGFNCLSNVCTKECADSAACNGGNCVDGACCSSSSCDEGQTCNYNPTLRGRCIKADGAACTLANECGSGNCVDGVCCDTTCEGGCEACNTPASAGTCAPVQDGLDPDEECAGDAPFCGGVCDGTGACRTPDASTVCAEVRCGSGTLLPQALCDGLGGACPEVSGDPCPNSLGCNPDGKTCRSSCTSDSHCAPGANCSSGTCVSTGVVFSCNTDDQCDSGHCVDDYCCNTSCEGTCLNCGLSGSLGICSAVPSGQDPDKECGDGSDSCSNSCDGDGECSAAASSKVCEPALCLSLEEAQVAVRCPGAGEPCPTPSVISCLPGRCRGGQCTLSCSDDDECTGGAQCVNGGCQEPPRDTGGCACNLAQKKSRSPIELPLLGLLGLLALRRRHW